jgi:O-antigen ligase
MSLNFRALTLAAFWLVVVIVMLAPLPLGGARPWAWSLLALLIGGVGMAWGIGYAFARPAFRRPKLDAYSTAAVLFMAVMFWALLQTVPLLPTDWGHPLWHQTSTALGQPVRAAIALDTESALTAVLRLMTAFLVFSTVAFTATGTHRAERLLSVLGAATVFYAAYGLWIFFTGNKTVVGLPKWAHLDDLTGTFANRNSFATFAGMGFLCLVSLLLQRIGRVPSGLSWRIVIPRVIEILFAPRTLVILAGAIVVLAALLLSHSRAGLITTLIGLVVLLALAVRGSHVPGWLRMTFGLLLFGIVGLFMLGGDGGTLVRLLDTNLEQESRPEVYRLMLQAIGDSPWLGYGLGNFGAVFPLYRDATVSGFYDRAHSDHLELILELGIPAAALLYVGFMVVVVHCWRGVSRRQRNKALPALGVAVAVQVGLHSCVDFSLQIPALTCFFAIVLGLSYAQATKNTVANGFQDDETYEPVLTRWTE